ncbi:hypothetical protein, partial [Actinoplanes octamycinicus]|uniref:hypothetical protein n=1 Tax=Actinoplanes octamycinicus TaxID=135948 RepID=UPI001945849B
GADRTTASNTSAPHFGGATSARTSSSTGASSAGAERPRSGKLAKHWARAERLFVRYGGRAIFLGQWVVGARTLMPRLAGRNGVPYRRFAAWHTPSATLWAVWMVGASYLAGASYQVLAARAGRAAGALTTLTLIVAGLILAGRWLGRHPFPVRPPHRTSPIQGFAARWHPAVTAAVSLSLLTALALLLIEVIPPVVRFSGLAAADEALATWSRSQWTSDGYLFALSTATSLSPRIPLTLAVAVALVRLWWPHRPPALCRSPRPTPQAPTRTTPHPAPHTPASTTPHPAPHNPAHAASHPAPHTPAGTTPQPAPHTPAGTTPQPAPHNPAHAASHPTPHPAGTTPQPAPQNPGRTTSHPAPDTPTRTEQRTGTNSRAAVHRLGAWLRSGLEAWKRHGLWSGLFKVAGPVLPAVVLETALAVIPHSGWRATDHLVFPSPVEFDGPVPLDAAAAALADMSAAATVQTAAALGLLAWLLSHGLPWKWQVTVWTSASVVIVTGAGCWVYLGWGRLSETVAAVLLGAAWAALNAAIWSSRTTPAPTPTAPAAANPTPELAPAPA